MPDEKLQATDTAVGMKMMVALHNNEEMKQMIEQSGMDTLNLVMADNEGFGTRAGDFNQSLNNAISPIKPASGWAAAPEDAKEFTILICGGFIRRLA